MAKPVIAKNETAYCVDASEASRGVGREPGVCGAFNKQSEARLEGGDVVRMRDSDGFRSLRKE